MLQQFRSVGAQSWLESREYLAEYDALNSHIHLEIWFFGTDAGGDQLGADGLLDRDFHGFTRLFKIRTWCLHHQCHLIVQKQLNRVGRSPNYFGTMASFTNIWRAQGNAIKLRKAWEEVSRSLCAIAK